MDISQAIIKLENDIKEFKVSQTIGDSNSRIYTIVKNYPITLSLAANQYSICEIIFTGERIFPNISVMILGTQPSNGMYSPRPGQSGFVLNDDPYNARMILDFGYSSSARTINTNLTLKADCKGKFITNITIV